MVNKVLTYSLIGIEAYLVEVECDISHGIPAFNIVGLPENTVKESKERIRSTIKNSRLPFPEHRITINLAPADLKKEGTSYDLPIALSILAQSMKIPPAALSRFLIAGELSLSGAVRKTRGSLSSALLTQRLSLQGLILPFDCAGEVARFTDVPVYPVDHLLDVISFLKQEKPIPRFSVLSSADTVLDSLDFSEISGQFFAKRALEISAAGRHNILLSGPPGAGKTMMAMRIPTILPPLQVPEALETTMIYSAAGLLEENVPFIESRPFRAPHHTSSEIAMVGGGSTPRPGEISLAHNGVLFLDEFPEFKRSVIESLRQPLESGVINISRAAMSVSFPARFLLITAMNPCPCGNYGDESRQCVCSLSSITKYKKRISGPILDRIDLQIEVPRVPVKELDASSPGERSADIRSRIIRVHKIQHDRFGTPLMHNSKMSTAMIKKHCALDPSARTLLLAATEKFHLSARSYNKILKIARTIADLDSSLPVLQPHIAEAIQLRIMDKAHI